MVWDLDFEVRRFESELDIFRCGSRSVGVAVPLLERDTEESAAGRELRDARECGCRLARGVAGTTVCVEVVERDEEDEEEGVGE